MTHEELIERLEKAEGPDTCLDELIWFVAEPSEYHRVFIPPAYTSSIDAALTLVPVGCDWDVGHIRDNGCATACVMWYLGWVESAKAPTPALALVIASLKARAALPPTAT